MRRFNISFSEEETFHIADKYLSRNCGFNLEKEKHRRMYKEARDVREKGLSGIHISAVAALFPGEAFQNHLFQAGDIQIECKAFTQIPDHNVKAVYLYMITAGECTCGQGESIMRRLFADMWGTAYIDAGRDLLEDMIKEDLQAEVKKDADKEGHLSLSFGPGFYGMSLEENQNIHELLQGKNLGVQVRENGVMIPLKTCSGLYLVVNDVKGLPKFECMSCVGNIKGCDHCRIRKISD